MIKQVTTFLFVLALLFYTGITRAAKIDTIYFQNGDRITGEVKSLESNSLRFSTYDARTIRIQWDKVDSVYIKNPMRITLQNGAILYGRLYPAGEAKYCHIGEQRIPMGRINLKEIVGLLPLDKRITSRMKGALSTGVNYTKASEILKFDFNGNVQYWSDKNLWEANYNIVLTDQKFRATTQRQNGGIRFNRVLPNNWFLQANIWAESNTLLQLDLRINIGIGAGKNLVYNNSQRLYTGAGVLFNREFTPDSTQFNQEGLITAKYLIYILESPEVSFNIRTDVIPSFNVSGRIRSEIDASLRWETFNDFYIKWTFYNSYDNIPLSKGNVKNDWGLTFGFEYLL